LGIRRRGKWIILDFAEGGCFLAHLGMTPEAEKIEAAVLEAVRQKKTTQDTGGSLGTREAGEWVAGRVAGEAVSS
jgi:isocitrate/isopropylmalate dehydrogenase